MKNARFHILVVSALFFVLNAGTCGRANAQATGSLFMLPENFHSQFFNPSYMRSDNSTVISIVGMAGTDISNDGNFEIADLVVKNQDGSLGLDFERFYSAGNLQNSLTDWSSVPIIYVSVPAANGRLSFYLKENIQSSLDFSLNELQFLANSNSTTSFRSYNTNDINFTGMGYRELTAGYAVRLNKRLNVGVRAKILFGGAYTAVENWSYGIQETENGEAELIHEGTGRISLPIAMNLDYDKRVLYVNSENMVSNYLATFHNPGLGIDLGATMQLTEKSWVSASATDLGAIWFRYNTMNIEQDTSVLFSGSAGIYGNADVENPDGYVDPYNLILETKDSHPYLYRPIIDTTSFVKTLVPKIALHYQYDFSGKLSVGVTEQAAFYENSYLNILSVSGLQKAGSFTVFENVNLYGRNRVTFGAGVQWEGRFLQIFAATDNLLAVGQPTRNESFSMAFGISLLLNKIAGKKQQNGSFSPYLPFYEIKK